MMFDFNTPPPQLLPFNIPPTPTRTPLEQVRGWAPTMQSLRPATAGSNASRYDSPVQLRKLFIGGLSHDTARQDLETYFSKFGEVEDAVVIREAITQHSRGFGFVTFKSIFSAESTMKHRPHMLGGKLVEMKRSIPRDQMQSMAPPPLFDTQPTAGCKLLLSGIVPEVHSVDVLRLYFDTFGTVDQIEIFGQPKGLGFIIYEKHVAADLCRTFNAGSHTVKGHTIEVRPFVANSPKARAQRPVDAELFERISHLHMMDSSSSSTSIGSTSGSEHEHVV